MVAAVYRARHLPGHFVLAIAALAAHAGHGTVEQFNHELLAGRAGNRIGVVQFAVVRGFSVGQFSVRRFGVRRFGVSPGHRSLSHC